MSSAKAVAETDRIGRLGVMYVRSILAQAGAVHGEVHGGEDHLAVDLTLTFPVGTVTVQVKTGTKKPNRDGSISVPTTKAWREKWQQTKTPVYLIYVRLDKKPPAGWIQHVAMPIGAAAPAARLDQGRIADLPSAIESERQASCPLDDARPITATKSRPTVPN